MCLFIFLVISIGLLSGPALSEDNNKPENIINPEKTKTSRKKNESSSYGHLGHTLAAVFKEFKGFLVSCINQMTIPSGKDKNGRKNVDSPTKNGSASSFNGVMKNAKSSLLKAFTSVKKGENSRITTPSNFGKAEEIEKFTNKTLEFVKYDTTISTRHSYNSNTLFQMSTTPYTHKYDESNTLEVSTKSMKEQKLKTEDSIGLLFMTKNLTSSPESKHESTQWASSSKLGLKRRSETTKLYSKIKQPKKNPNDYLSLYDEYDSPFHKDFFKIMQKKHLTHSEEYKLKWEPITHNTRKKAGKRLLPGKSFKNTFTKKRGYVKSDDKGLSKINFQELINTLNPQKPASNTKIPLESIKMKKLENGHPQKNFIPLPKNVKLRKMFRYNDKNYFMPSWSEKQFDSIVSSIGKNFQLDSTFVVLTPKPNYTKIKYEHWLSLKPNKRAGKWFHPQMNTVGKVFEPEKMITQRIRMTTADYINYDKTIMQVK